MNDKKVLEISPNAVINYRTIEMLQAFLPNEGSNRQFVLRGMSGGCVAVWQRNQYWHSGDTFPV